MISFLSDYFSRIRKMFLGNPFFRHVLKWRTQGKPNNILPTPAPHPLYPSGIGGSSPIQFRDSPGIPVITPLQGEKLPPLGSDAPPQAAITPISKPIDFIRSPYDPDATYRFGSPDIIRLDPRETTGFGPNEFPKTRRYITGKINQPVQSIGSPVKEGKLSLLGSLLGRIKNVTL